jgi:hypothetical protein
MPNKLQELIEAAGTQAIEQFCLDNLPAVLDAVLTGNKGPIQDAMTVAGASPTASTIRASVPVIPRPEIIKIKHSSSGHYINQPVPAASPASELWVYLTPPAQPLPAGTIIELMVRRSKGRWSHPTPSTGSIMSRSKFNGGSSTYAWDFATSTMTLPIPTEWSADAHAVSFFPSHYYGGENDRGKLQFPIAQPDWVTTPAARTAKSKNFGGGIKNSTKQQFFKFRYSVQDPNGRPTDRIVGPDSAVFAVFPELGTFEGGAKYYWRLLAIASRD